MIFPLYLIVIMSWSVFWIPPAKAEAQIGISATSMLTLIAFIFATTNMVPVLGYTTRFDQFIIGSTVLVFLALLQSVITSYLVASDRIWVTFSLDRVCRFAFPLAFVGLTIIVFLG